MKILVDANAPRSLVEELRQAGHDVAWIQEIDKAMPDPDIVDLAARETGSSSQPTKDSAP